MSSDEGLDARIAADCERSGVPFHVEDEAVLDMVASMIAEQPALEGGGRDAA